MRKRKKRYVTNKQTIAELRRLYKASGGLLMPEDIVESARNPQSPLHKHFEWDNTTAAQKWRIHQARNLLRVTVEVINVDGSDVPMRVFCSLSDDQDDEGGYRATVDILSDSVRKQILLSDALRDIEIFTEKYGKLKELARIVSVMLKVKKKLR